MGSSRLQFVVDRAAGGGKEHVSAAAARHPAADERRGSYGGGGPALDCWPSAEAERVVQAAISQSASHGLGRGPRWWRFPPAARRDFPGPQRRIAVSYTHLTLP